MKEANLISFKVLINSKGQVVTELSGLPEEKIDQVFKTKHVKTMMRKIIKESKVFAIPIPAINIALIDTRDKN